MRRTEREVEGDPLQRAIVFNDLRNTELTHMAVPGELARGQTKRRRIGNPLPLLSQVSWRPGGVSDRFRLLGKPPRLSSRSHSGILRPQRELNPCYRRERPVS